MGKISRSDEGSVKTDFLYGSSPYRSFWSPFFSRCKGLIISTVFFLLIFISAKGQITNELAFDSIVVGYCVENGNDIRKVTGFLTEGLNSGLEGKLKGKDTLEINPPTVSFEKLDSKKILRKLEVEMTVDQKSGQMKMLSYQDTLSRKDLRKVRSTKHPALKGEHPGLFKRYILPAAALAGGVASIASLFYIRSR